MPLLEACCCWNSVRKGSFASGIFTLAFYTVVFTTCAFHVSTFAEEPWMFRLSLAMLVLSGTCVVTSVLLIVGLCGDNKQMIMPWIFSIFFTTILDIILCVYLITDLEFDLGLVIFVVTDISVCAINIYAIVCVFSQYQEYSAGRGQAGLRKSNRKGGRTTRDNRYHLNQLPGDCVALKITNEVELSTSMSPTNGYLTLPSPTRSTSLH